MHSRTVAIGFPAGLHARPAALVAQAAATYESAVWAVKDGQRVDAASPLSLMLLEAGHGAEIEIIAEGEDEVAAAEAVAALIEKGEVTIAQ